MAKQFSGAAERISGTVVTGESSQIVKLIEGFCSGNHGEKEGQFSFLNGGSRWPENKREGGGSTSLTSLI